MQFQDLNGNIREYLSVTSSLAILCFGLYHMHLCLSLGSTDKQLQLLMVFHAHKFDTRSDRPDARVEAHGPKTLDTSTGVA